MGVLDWWKLNPNAGGTVYDVPPGGTFSTFFGNPAPTMPTSGRIAEVATPMPPAATDERLVPTSRKVPEVTAPIVGPEGKKAPDERLVPTPASTAPGTPATQAGNIYDRLMALQKEGKLGPMIGALAKSFGAGGELAPKAPAWRGTLQGGNPGYHPGNPSSAAQIMQGLTGGAEKREAERLKKQKRRESDRYDILGGRG